MISYNREIFILGLLISLSAAVGLGIGWAAYRVISLLHVGVVGVGLLLVGLSFWIMGGGSHET